MELISYYDSFALQSQKSSRKLTQKHRFLATDTLSRARVGSLCYKPVWCHEYDFLLPLTRGSDVYNLLGPVTAVQYMLHVSPNAQLSHLKHTREYGLQLKLVISVKNRERAGTFWNKHSYIGIFVFLKEMKYVFLTIHPDYCKSLMTVSELCNFDTVNRDIYWFNQFLLPCNFLQRLALSLFG